jgi:hypothetical protein
MIHIALTGFAAALNGALLDVKMTLSFRGVHFFQMILLVAIVIAENNWIVGNFGTKVICKDCLELVGQGETKDGQVTRTTTTIQQQGFGSSSIFANFRRL